MPPTEPSVRIYHRLPGAIKDRFEKHAAEHGARIGEMGGFAFRRVIFHAVKAFDAGICITKFCEGVELLIELHGHGCCFHKAKKKIKEIVKVCKE